ncbi:hypothetical protein FB45DRAFT_1026108 [Roridomyces roridus]|uniref:Zn(2)-C6 fungal-type domain-containing protein n=1 Tax=Roridomyces roridus TaxID=1738132 RepID=A0AAD7BZU2_9AGAR|nr:hypothetical protein FB45DRAFT_1026108 [Roridomyces roridus]
MDLSVEPQAPGDVLIELEDFAPEAVDLVRLLYTVPDVLCERCVERRVRCTFERWGACCTECVGTNHRCRFELQEWFIFFNPPTPDSRLLCHTRLMVFTELWYWLKINGLEPWMFYDCDEEGWPAVLTEPIRGYISSSYDRTLLSYLQSLFLHEGRLLLLADVRNRLSTLSRIDCPPSHYSSTVEAARQDPSLIVRRSDRIF